MGSAEDLAPEQVAHDEEHQVFGVVDALVLEGEVVPARQMADRDHHGVEHEGHNRVAEELRRSRAQHLGDGDVGRSARGAPGQLQRRGDGEERRRHHDEQEVLDHVVPEQLGVVDADEAENGEARRRQRADPRRGPPSRPRVPWVQRVVAPDTPEIERQRGHDHGDRDEVELGGEELPAGQRREPRRRARRSLPRRYRRVQPCCQTRCESPRFP